MSTNNSVNSSLSGATGSGSFVGSTSPSITTPKIVSQILDTNGNPIIGLGVTSSAVNYLTITNQSTGVPPFLSASGSDTNISINIAPKGAGLVNLITAATTNPLTITSGTSSQHTTTFNFSNTSASRSVTFPDLTGTVALSGASQSVSFNDVTLSTALTVGNGGTGVMTTPSNGQLLIGNGSGYTLATLTAGDNISITNAAGSITIAGLAWTEVTGTSQTMVSGNGYISSNSSLVTLTLPATASVGAVIRVQGKGSGGWKIAQNASQVIHFGNVDTTTGTSGYLASTNRYDSIQLLCIAANTDWSVISAQGAIDYN